jgi:hypothetical protein
MNAPSERVRVCAERGEGGRGETRERTPTSAQTVRTPEDPTLFDLPEGREHHADLVLPVLLGNHADEELPILHRCGAERETEWEKERERQTEREGERVRLRERGRQRKRRSERK